MIGSELGGRYEVVERIGGGGMAIVYRGVDLLLHRQVAIKVLRQQFVHDEDFIRRFRREAQAAASLSHPNVVSIYDVGQQDEVHYIVMEYIEGHNLNDRIKEQAPLQVEDAIHIASQICDALAHAHHNQIIHRDIKPHNILIGKNGRVKVTDFGIARAATSSDITQTGAVLGSVHYFSPEHAKGVQQGTGSDLYSLGVVLYQMVTGRLPFIGESPISVALKHLQEDFEDPKQINPMLPQSVENIILKSLRKNPAERYQTAEEMLADLETALDPRRSHEPKLAVSSHDGEDDEQRTIIMPAIRGNYKSETSLEDTYVGGDRTRSHAEEHDEKRWKRPLILAGVWIAILAVAIFGAWYGIKLVLNLLDVPEVDVPEVIGMEQEEAIRTLEQFNLVADPIIEQYKDDVEKGIVYDQEPRNMVVNENSTVRLYVSLGPELLDVPELVGQSWERVERELAAYGLNPELVTVEEEFSEEEVGTILEQSPLPGESFNPKTDELHLVISKGLDTFEMPNVVGYMQNVAESILERNGLQYEVKTGTDYSVQKGIVYMQHPYRGGEMVSKGEKITIYVSEGYPEDALMPTRVIEIEPEVEGEPSTIRIVYSDARGEDREWDTREIKERVSLPITVVVSPNKDAIIRYYVNDKFGDSFTVTYEDALNQHAPAPNMSEAGTSVPANTGTESTPDGDSSSDSDLESSHEQAHTHSADEPVTEDTD
ncbi:Stk1 family PASTA domain-containing Ser/Thr kinase [Xylanibacillus composti]|uniref:Serine/threonine-protein kinase PrkC n=1 Tax=Xylanibacillus composti TaxID=1572762 RepID=A0A8J4GYR9_9BACL|nr:Stk1 family PASTA domain-containing Ser/Thr kinase [Xylanibacillus composti]MDT9725600.1 Stk1 family PASTA domain-containing Ser/Thr kinase [Xylanibacillus composti]GIQ67693.1 serine/threonine-protein kinase PrkC [Xylanibacillus composti]